MGNKKKKKKKESRKDAPLPRSVLAVLERAAAHLQGNRWAEAAELLEEADRRQPGQREVLAFLADAYFHLRDMPRYLHVSERLAALEPGKAALTLQLAAACLANNYPARALLLFRRVLERWPDHPRADDARRAVADLEAPVDSIVKENGLEGPDGLQLEAWNEEVLELLARSENEAARGLASKILERRPQFAPALNNSSEALSRAGRYGEAIEMARRVLGFDPDNVHALANLTRFLFLAGQHDEARATAERLKALVSPRKDAWPKKIEALSYLGDDQGVLDAWRSFNAAGGEGPPASVALLRHLAAVALARQGQEDEARRLWQEALEVSPGFGLARGNLEDFRRPVGERHAPWPYTFPHWLAAPTLDELARLTGPEGRKVKDEALRSAVVRFLEAHPEVRALVPVLLDRGDPQARPFFLRMALIAGTPEMLADLRAYALGQRGPDALRREAAQGVSQAGLLPAGPVRLWQEGEWTEVLLLSWELYDEPDHKHGPRVEKLATRAWEALHQRDGVRAEQILRQALEIEPAAPDLLNNLSAAYLMQGREQEGNELIRRIHAEHPDYFFARTSVARMAAKEGDVERAAALLEPLLKMRRMHVSEFAALATAQVDLALARGHRDSARSWCDLLEQAAPDNPNLPALRLLVQESRWSDRLRGMSGWPRR